MGNTALSRLMGIYDGVWCSQKYSPGVPWLDTEAGKWGVYTSSNKEYMIQFLIDAIREGLWTDPDEAFWREALNVVRNDRGLAETKGRDRVAARFILATIDRLGPAAEYPRLEMEQRPTDYRRGQEAPAVILSLAASDATEPFEVGDLQNEVARVLPLPDDNKESAKTGEEPGILTPKKEKVRIKKRRRRHLKKGETESHWVVYVGVGFVCLALTAVLGILF